MRIIPERYRLYNTGWNEKCIFEGGFMNINFDKQDVLHAQADLNKLADISDFVRKCYHIYGASEKSVSRWTS